MMSNSSISFIEQLINAGEYEKAETACIELLDKNENNAEAFSKLGEIYLSQSKDIEAQIFFEKAEKIDPNYLPTQEKLNSLKSLLNKSSNDYNSLIKEQFNKNAVNFSASIINEPNIMENNPIEHSLISNTKDTKNLSLKFSFNSEEKEQKLVRKLIKKGMTIFDVGANIGDYTKLFSLLTGDDGNVHSFEASYQTYKKLKKIKEDYGLNNIFFENVAVYSDNTEVTLNEFQEEYSAWNSIGFPVMDDPNNPQKIVPIIFSNKVRAIKIDSYCKERNISTIDYLKIDIEGAEIYALKGASELLKEKKIKYLQFEISQKMLEGIEVEAIDVFNFLHSMDYECHEITEEGEIGERALGSSSFYENYIAFPIVIHSNIIPPEIKDDEFYYLIQKLSREENIHSVLEIGSSSGGGSTEAFVKGLRENQNHPQLFCMEIEPDRFENLYFTYQRDSFVHCYNVSSVDSSKLPTENDVTEFYRLIKTNLNFYPLDQVLGWLRQDKKNIEKIGTEQASGIALIKQKNKIDVFDMVLIDGSEFTGEAELGEVYGARILLLDDIIAYKNYRNFIRLINDPNYTLIASNQNLRNGYAVFKKNDKRWKERKEGAIVSNQRNHNLLPIHFFTIVLNGKPFIEYHINVFKKLPFKWHWHIVEGVADLINDTAWSLKNGANISDEFHKNGLSNDGTTEYLKELKKLYPQNITIYRKEIYQFWKGKLEMVNAPLSEIKEECLLWQVDVDELWTLDQIVQSRQLYVNNPQKTASYYLCNFFVGERLFISSTNTYGNHTEYEWLRTWRYKPGDKWISHEPPALSRIDYSGEWIDVGKINPFKHSVTKHHNLIFQHYAYVLPEQLMFKEKYYGYNNALSQWKGLQKETHFPQQLKNYFSWVTDEAIVDKIDKFNISPLATIKNGKWFVKINNTKEVIYKKILFIRTDAIGDNVLASIILKGIKEKFPKSEITVFCEEHITILYKYSPYVKNIIGIDKKKFYEEPDYKSTIISNLNSYHFDVAINSVYSSEAITDIIMLACGAKQTIRIDGNYENSTQQRVMEARELSTFVILTTENRTSEIDRHKEFLNGLGIEARNLTPEIWLSKEDEKFADQFFDENDFNPEKTISLFPFTQWPIKDFENIRYLLSSPILDDFKFIILGGGSNSERAKPLLNLYPNKVYSLVGEIDLLKTAAIIKKSRLLIGADSSGPHIACAVSTPNVVIMGGGHFGRFFPYSELTSIITLPLSCYGCNWQCRFERAYCVKDNDLELVLLAIENILRSKSIKPRIYYNELVNENRRDMISKMYAKFLSLDKVEIIEVKKHNILQYSKKLLFLAEEAIQSGKYIDGKFLLENILQVDSSNIDALNDLAVIEILIKNWETASKYLNQVIEIDPHNKTGFKNSNYLKENFSNQISVKIEKKVLKREQENNAKLLSIIVQGKNDNYMGNFIWRLSTNINKVCQNLQELNLTESVELILVDWGSETRLITKLSLTEEAKGLLKIITVNKEIADKYNRDSHYSMVHAINTGIRRAAGKFVLFCDGDTYIPFKSMEKLIENIQNEKFLEDYINHSLFMGSRFHIPKAFQLSNPNLQELDTYIDQNQSSFVHDKISLSNFLGTATAYLMRREMWFECRGFDESLIYWGWFDIDLFHRIKSKYRIYDFEDFSVPLFHLEHYNNSEGRDIMKENPRKINPEILSFFFAPNNDDWGLANENLRLENFEQTKVSSKTEISNFDLNEIKLPEDEQNKFQEASVNIKNIRSFNFDLDQHNHIKRPLTVNLSKADKNNSTNIIKNKIIIDGIIFQLQRNMHSEISCYWKSMLSKLSKSSIAESILLLDRGSTAPYIPGINKRMILPFTGFAHSQADSKYLQDIYEEEDGKIFISTYYSFPLSGASIVMVHDFNQEITNLPGKFWIDMWNSVKSTINSAFAYISVSHSAASDLYRLFDIGSTKNVYVIPNAANDNFRKNSPQAIDSFKKKYNITKPYFLVYDDRLFNMNNIKFIKGFIELKDKFEILFIGGPKNLDPEYLQLLKKIKYQNVFLVGIDLSIAYTGAVALVYSSKFEGLGLPILEAQRSGCPVITSNNSLISEVAGEAAIYVEEDNVLDIGNAFINVQKSEVRKVLINKGFKNSENFSWAKSAELFTQAIKEILNELPESAEKKVSNLGKSNEIFYEIIKDKVLFNAYYRIENLFYSPNVTIDSEFEIYEKIIAESSLFDNEYFNNIQNVDDPFLLYFSGLRKLKFNVKSYAAEALMKAIKNGLGHWRLAYIVAQLAIEVGQKKDAEEILNSIIKTNPNHENSKILLDKLKGIEIQTEKKIKVSAIVSTYNSEKFIDGCLQDLVEQTLFKKGEMEIIVVNTGSQQNEKRIVNKFQQKYLNIKYAETKTRETIYTAWNIAIAHSQGKLLTNANTDDRHKSDALEIMAAEFDKNPDADVVYADIFTTVQPNDNWGSNTSKAENKWIQFDKDLILFGCFIGPQPMWKKSLHEKYGNFREELKVVGDYEFWLRISREAKFIHLNEKLGLYFYSTGSVEHKNKSLTEDENRRIQNEYFIKYVSDLSGVERIKNKLAPVKNAKDGDEYFKNAMRVLELREKGLNIQIAIANFIQQLDQYTGENFNKVSASIQSIICGNNSIVDKSYIENFYLVLGVQHFKNGNIDQSKKMFDNALKINGFSSNAFVGLGEVNFLNNNYLAAGEMFTKALKIDPKNQTALNGLKKIDR